MELDFEQQLAEAMGVTEEMAALNQEAGETAETTETAPQTEDQTEAGAKEQAAAEPAKTEEKEPQTIEERRIHAERRRKQETDEKIRKAVEADRAQRGNELDAFIASTGMKDSFTGEPITTKAEFDAWQKKFREDQKDKALASGKLSQEIVDQMLEDNPTMQAMAEFVRTQGQQPQTEPTQARTITAEEQTMIDSELAEIRKLDPSIQGIGDLMSMETAEEFARCVDAGFGFLDAYKMANHDAIVAAEAQALAGQAAAAQDRTARGKGHLTGTTGVRGAGAQSVPAEDMAWMRQVNPGATAEEITAWWQKDIKLHPRK